MSNESVKQDAIASTRKEFGSTELKAVSGEIQGMATAAAASAAVESRYKMALHRPRNLALVRQNLLAEVSDPEFALDKSAIYHKPVGEGIEGLGIRFAEVAARCLTNVLVEAPTVYEDDLRRQVRVTVTDLESNLTYMKDIVINKTVERLSINKGDVVLSVRTNSQGNPTYTIPASEAAMYNKENGEASKAIRNGVLRLIPVGLQNECKKIIYDIREKKVREDPKKAEKAIVDGFAHQNVSVTMLEEFLGHPVAQCTPAEIVNLQALYGALRDGETTWAEIMADVENFRKLKRKPKAETTGNATETKTEPTRGVEAAKAKVTSSATKPAEQRKTEPARAATPKQEPAGQPPAASEPATDSEAPPWLAEPSESEPEQQNTQPDPSLESKVAELADELGDELAGEPIVRVKPKNAEIHGVTLPEFCDVAGYDEAPTEAQTEALIASFDDLCAAIGAQKSLSVTVKNFVGVELGEINGATAEALTKVFPVIQAKKAAAKAK